MAHTPPTTPFGTTIALASPGISLGEIVDVQISCERAVIDVTHFGSVLTSGDEFGGREFIPGDLAELEMVVTAHFDADTDTGLADSATECTLTWGSGGTIWGFSCFVSSYVISATENDKMTAVITLKADSSVNIT